MTKRHALNGLHLALARDPRDRFWNKEDSPYLNSLCSARDVGEVSGCPLYSEKLQPLSRQVWMVVSDEPTTLQTLREYGERFQIEEELLERVLKGGSSRQPTHSSRQQISSTQRRTPLFKHPLKGCLHQDWKLFPTILLQGGTDPDPAIAFKKQAQQQFEREFTVKSYRFAA